MTVNPASPYQTGPNSSDLWIRKWALTLKGPSGDLTLSQASNDPEQDGLRITFRTQQTRVGGNGLPGQALITVYNPTAQTVMKARTQEFNRAILAAGYRDGRYGIIFDGIIAYWEHGREDTLTETYLRLQLQDGDLAYNWAKINQTLTAGHSAKDAVAAAVGQMKEMGVVFDGNIEGVLTAPMPRGHSLYGSAKDIFDDYGASYFTQNGALHIFDPKKPISSQTKVLNSMTGLVGMPRQTTNGVEATTLLDPTLLLGAQVQIDQKDINQVAPGVGLNGQPLQQPSGNATGVAVQEGFGVGYRADVSADGVYAVWVIEHEGDSRGNPWYSHLICYAAGKVPNVGSSLLDYGTGPTSGQIGTANAAQSVPDWGPSGP